MDRGLVERGEGRKEWEKIYILSFIYTDPELVPEPFRTYRGILRLL